MCGEESAFLGKLEAIEADQSCHFRSLLYLFVAQSGKFECSWSRKSGALHPNSTCPVTSCVHLCNFLTVSASASHSPSVVSVKVGGKEALPRWEVTLTHPYCSGCSSHTGVSTSGKSSALVLPVHLLTPGDPTGCFRALDADGQKQVLPGLVVSEAEVFFFFF